MARRRVTAHDKQVDRYNLEHYAIPALRAAGRHREADDLEDLYGIRSRGRSRGGRGRSEPHRTTGRDKAVDRANAAKGRRVWHSMTHAERVEARRKGFIRRYGHEP